MKKRFLALVLALVMALGLVACGNGGDTTDTTDVPETYFFTDDVGREVEVPTEITRIVPSGPLSQIILFAIAPEMFVGLASKWNECAEGYIPEEYFDLPYFGQLYGSSDLSVEELALADPQLIIDIGAPKESAVADLDALQTQTQIPSVFISASLEAMPETFRTLGKLLGKEEKGEQLAQFCQKIYDRTISVMDKVGENKVKALYVVGEKGLNVIANGSYHAEMVDMLTDNLAVVDNPLSKGTGNEVTMEQIAIWNPELVIFAPDSIYADAATTAAWKEISAIKAGNYVEVPEGPHDWMGMPPAVQRYLGLIWLTAVLYPDYCDYDVEAEVKEYYSLFYGCELTDAQYDALTANAFLR